MTRERENVIHVVVIQFVQYFVKREREREFVGTTRRSADCDPFRTSTVTKSRRRQHLFVLSFFFFFKQKPRVLIGAIDKVPQLQPSNSRFDVYHLIFPFLFFSGGHYYQTFFFPFRKFSFKFVSSPPPTGLSISSVFFSFFFCFVFFHVPTCLDACARRT